jgi:chemotaxis protein MotB
VLFRSEANVADDANATTALLELGLGADEHEDNWLVSYADLLSVIFAMVVLLFGRMFAMAAVAPETAAGGDPVHFIERAALVAPAPSTAPAEPATPESRPEDRLATLVDQRFSGRIETRRRDRGIALAIPAVALFTSARADLEPAAIPLLTELTATLREVGDARIAVEGHTDDLPVQGGAFDSNWSLAAARANAVTRFLLEQGFAPDRLQSVSFADTRPVADNATADGRAANRRVELQIELAPETR